MTALLAAVHFVSPLLFFTDLTRNPYYTQIALVNLGVTAAAAMWVARGVSEGRWTWVRTPLDLPWALLLAVAGMSWLHAYWTVPAFFHPSMRSEGLHGAVFLWVNAFLVYELAVHCAPADPGDADVPLGAWVAFVLLWGAAWTFYPQLRAAPSGIEGLWPHLWDPFGALMWASGLAAVLWLTRRGRSHDFWHLILATGFLGAVYGICQYFGVEFFWPKILNPYGGRSVSTFGNPNFMSSYMLMLPPVCVVYYLKARSRWSRVVYAAVFLALEASLLCSLTRSSWVGAAAALAPLAFSKELRRLAKEDLEFHGLVAAAAVALAALWPQSSVHGYAPSVLGRLEEMRQALHPSTKAAYSPLYQRLLIWLCAWTMGAEHPLIGKGWGLFELFYPFYQGHYLMALDVFRTLRTHANNAHNEVLELFSQTGILGLGAAALLWTAFFKRVAAAMRSARGRPAAEPVWALAAAGGVLGMLADNMLNVSMHFAVPALLFYWQAGTAMGILSRREQRVREVAAPRPKALAATALALAAALAVDWDWTCQWRRETLYFDGFKLMRRGDAAAAVPVLEEAWRWQHHEVNTDYELGNAYARSGRFDKAVWAYQQALDSNAGYDEIWFNLGTLLSLKLGRPDEALRDYRVSWGINPMSQPTTANYAALLLKNGGAADLAEAERVLAWGETIDPGNMNIAMSLAALQDQRGEYASAERVYEQLLSRQPNLAPAVEGLRRAAAASRGPAPALLAPALEFRALEQRIMKKDYGDETLAMARRAAQAFPGAPAAHFYLGNLELIHRDAAGAAGELAKVVSAQPSNLGAKINLGQALKALGRREEAADMFQQVLAADPSNALARSELAGLR